MDLIHKFNLFLLMIVEGNVSPSSSNCPEGMIVLLIVQPFYLDQVVYCCVVCAI
jgi:hypothetical protein